VSVPVCALTFELVFAFVFNGLGAYPSAILLRAIRSTHAPANPANAIAAINTCSTSRMRTT
jgi:hypothetical protein